MKIAYCIQSSGEVNSRSVTRLEDPPLGSYLQIHLDRLAKTDTSKITNVILSKPILNPQGSIAPGYYNLKKARKLLRPKLIEFPCKNQYQSYGQLIQTFLAFPDYDFYISLEDDYFPAT